MVLDEFDIPNSFSNEDEHLLLQKISEGDRKAYAVLHSRYQASLYQYILRFTNQSKSITEEVVQEIFIHIWEKRTTLLAIRNFDAYLKKAAKNKLLNHLKHNEFKARLHQQFSNRLSESKSLVEEDSLYNDYHKIALEAIHQLPEKRKLIFLLSTEENLSLTEIAELLQVSKSRVKQQLYSGTAFIKDYLRKNAEWLLFIFLCW